MDKAALLNQIIELRHLKTVKSNFLDIEVDKDNRIRTSYSIVETGRLASHEDELGEGTHLQNVPLEVRNMFIADEGKLLVEADKKQGEVMIVAWLAREERMKEAFKSGVDIHQFNADNLKMTRKMAKTYTHGWDYGRKKEPEAREKYFIIYPGILRWQKEIRLELMKSKSLTNSFGRKRIFFGRLQYKWEGGKVVDLEENDTVREAYAYNPQSTLVDDLNRGLIELFYKGEPKIQILHQGHDSVLGQVEENEVGWATKLMKECLVKPFICGGDKLTIPIEIKVGKNWGEMKEGE